MAEKPHAPYIVPGGLKFTYSARPEREGQTHHKKKSRAHKDDLWIQLQRNKVTAVTEQELHEVHAIERAGHRRRRRWLNEKVLRDMAGPMSAQDMQAQFSPVPFGSSPPPSAFAVASSVEHLLLWDHFRNIDLDKEARLLQRWEQHNLEQRQQVQQRACPGVALTPQQQQEAAAAAALGKWRSVSRSARCALKRANVHSVLELEMQVLQVLHAQGTHRIQLELRDGFARLLVHGLAEFHGLCSSTCVENGAKLVTIEHKQRAQQQHQSVQHSSRSQSPSALASGGEADLAVAAHSAEAQGHSSSSSSGGGSSLRAGGEGASDYAVHAAGGAGGDELSGSAAGLERGSRGADWLLWRDEITCSDVIMALHELGSSFEQHALGRYMMTHVHGGASDTHRSKPPC